MNDKFDKIEHVIYAAVLQSQSWQCKEQPLLTVICLSAEAIHKTLTSASLVFDDDRLIGMANFLGEQIQNLVEHIEWSEQNTQTEKKDSDYHERRRQRQMSGVILLHVQAQVQKTRQQIKAVSSSSASTPIRDAIRTKSSSPAIMAPAQSMTRTRSPSPASRYLAVTQSIARLSKEQLRIHTLDSSTFNAELQSLISSLPKLSAAQAQSLQLIEEMAIPKSRRTAGSPNLKEAYDALSVVTNGHSKHGPTEGNTCRCFQGVYRGIKNLQTAVRAKEAQLKKLKEPKKFDQMTILVQKARAVFAPQQNRAGQAKSVSQQVFSLLEAADDLIADIAAIRAQAEASNR